MNRIRRNSKASFRYYIILFAVEIFDNIYNI